MSRYVIIPDSFKGTLSSADICRIVSREIRAQEPEAAVCAIPVADGGEGTVDAFLAAVGGERVTVQCAGPYGEPVSAFYGMLPDGSAVVESAGRRAGTGHYRHSHAGHQGAEPDHRDFRDFDRPAAGGRGDRLFRLDGAGKDELLLAAVGRVGADAGGRGADEVDEVKSTEKSHAL